MALTMYAVNLSPDSFWKPSRTDEGGFPELYEKLTLAGADWIDLGAVSTRPGAEAVDGEEEWKRLEGTIKWLAGRKGPAISVDTVRSETVRRVYDILGPFTVNDISAGEDDARMLPTVAELGLEYIAMHKRGTPATMDSLCDYPEGVVKALTDYFSGFSEKAAALGINDWILDPGLGFAKTVDQCWEILENLEALKVFGKRILVGTGDKRFTSGRKKRADETALLHGADIIRRHFKL